MQPSISLHSRALNVTAALGAQGQMLASQSQAPYMPSMFKGYAYSWAAQWHQEPWIEEPLPNLKFVLRHVHATCSY